MAFQFLQQVMLKSTTVAQPIINSRYFVTVPVFT